MFSDRGQQMHSINGENYGRYTNHDQRRRRKSHFINA